MTQHVFDMMCSASGDQAGRRASRFHVRWLEFWQVLFYSSSDEFMSKICCVLH